jgi:hypothetical protein
MTLCSIVQDGKSSIFNPTLDMAADSSDDYLSIAGHGVAQDRMKESMESMDSAQKHSSLHGINCKLACSSCAG